MEMVELVDSALMIFPLLEMSQRLTSLKSLSWPYATNGHAINWLDRGGEETKACESESDPWKLGRVSIISDHLRTEDEIKKAN